MRIVIEVVKDNALLRDEYEYYCKEGAAGPDGEVVEPTEEGFAEYLAIWATDMLCAIQSDDGRAQCRFVTPE